MEHCAAQKQTPKSERTHSRILEAGMDLIRVKGYENVTIRDICDSAEVSIGAFYSHFKNKQALFRSFHQNTDLNFAAMVEEKLKGDTAVERMIDFVRYYAWLNIGTGVQDLKLIMNLNQNDSDTLPLHDLLNTLVEEGQGRGELSAEMPSREITEMLFAFMRGCCYEWCRQNGAFDLEGRLISYLTRLISTFRI